MGDRSDGAGPQCQSVVSDVVERAAKDVERRITVVDRDLESETGLGVGDADGDPTVAGIPQQPDVQPAARPCIELAAGAGRSHLVLLARAGVRRSPVSAAAMACAISGCG
jgi:hypothetical protein